MNINRVAEILSSHFSEKEIKKMIAFFRRGFSPKGEEAIAYIFVYAMFQEKSAEEILAACAEEWRETWRFQNEALRADPSVAGKDGEQNRASVENVFKRLVILSPEEQNKKISKEAIVVHTQNSIYRIGKEYKNGRRTIACDGKRLPSTHCRIIFLARGCKMKLEMLDCDKGCEWTSSRVISIEAADIKAA